MNLARLLAQIAIILALCGLLRGLLGRMGQPPVMGEIIAGLLLGPSFLGWMATLNGLSQIGLVLFMFLVGLRLDLSEVIAFRHRGGPCGLAEHRISPQA